MTQFNLDTMKLWPTFGWPLSSTSIAALSVYAVGGFDPKLALDFIGNTYRTGGADSTLANSVTHARAGQATMVDSDGLLKWSPHNFLTRSEELNRWTQSGTGSVVVDNAVAPDGTTTAATLTISSVNLHRYIRSSATYTAGDKITFSFWVRSDTVTTLPLGINGGTVGANNYIFSDVAVTSTWQLVEFEFTVLGSDTSLYYIIGKQSTNPVNNQLGDIEIWHPHAYRSDLGGMVNNSATSNSYVPTTSSAVYAPRVGHHVYNGSAWVNEGILHESEARTNLLTSSGDVSGTGWTGSMTRGAVTAGSPLGTYQTISPVSNGIVDIAIRYQLGKTLTSGATYVTSSLVKYSAGSGWFILRPYDTGLGGRRAWFDLQNGVVGTKDADVLDYGMIDYGDGWWLCWASDNVSSTSGGFIVEVPNSNGGFSASADDVILIAGTQYEQGTTPSSYIPTSGSAVTRAAETLTVPAANLPYNYVETTGTELVTNGTFDSNTNDWTGFNATLSVDSNRLKVTNTASFGQAIAQTFTTVSGKTYLVTGDLIAGNVDGYINVNEGQYGSGIFNGTSDRTSTDTSFSITFKAVSHITKITLVNFFGSIGDFNLWDNVSVKEINPLALSIQMDGKMSWTDENISVNKTMFSWTSDASNFIRGYMDTGGALTGRVVLQSKESGVDDFSAKGSDDYTAGTNVAFNISSRHGSSFLNHATDGTALTANTTPTALPNLSSSTLSLGFDFMGTIGQFRMWDEDLTDAGIIEATEPSTEPSLQLTFDGSSTSSFTVLDWSE